MSILLIEDNPRFVELLRHSLEGVDLVVAGTLAVAIHLLDTQCFTLALVDLGLPDSLPGHTLGALRAYKVPKVVITAGSTVTPAEAAAQGAADYIEKTTPIGDLVARIRFNMAKHQPRRRPFDAAVFEQIKVCLSCRELAAI